LGNFNLFVVITIFYSGNWFCLQRYACVCFTHAFHNRKNQIWQGVTEWQSQNILHQIISLPRWRSGIIRQIFKRKSISRNFCIL